LFLYQSTHEDAKDDASLEAKAKAAVGDVFVRYTLKEEDFRFIAPPKAETIGSMETPSVPRALPVGRRPAGSPGVAKVAPTYERLIASLMLAYRTPWEFVAERFHCSESYLRALNSNLPAVPGIGAEFQVPNVIPFEIESALTEPLQPQADPENPVTASVVGLAQLNIYRSGALVAVFPLSSARPGLRGRGTWTILGAIPRPRLATRQEEWKEQSRQSGPLFGSSTPAPTPTPFKPKLASEQFLAAGPRNPAGVLWINLAKSDSSEPLPYGLHGTSIPDQMNVLESVGGLRLTNWDIARAVRQLPFGTPLEWKQ
jgi:lipoprotein-anchoring transpeptidase ErfK/SrfK